MASLIAKLVPENLAQEQAKFLANTSYNPQFTYREPVTAAQLLQYGLPDKELASLAAKKVANYVHKRHEIDGEPVSREQMSKYFERLFKRLQLPSIALIFDAKQLTSAKMCYQPEPALSTKRQFSLERWENLLDHEIQTHYLIHLNEHRKFLGTEEGEGLAVINSYRSRSDKTLWKSWLLYYSVDLALRYSFSETFLKLRPHFTNDVSTFKAVLRVKRGLTDTSKPGAFTKDLFYISGFVKVASWILNGGDPRQLYQGRRTEPIYPTFFQDMARYRRQVELLWAANMDKP